MTEVFIKDGEGSGIKAGVTTDKRLKTDSITLNTADYNSVLGQAFNINTGKFTLSSSNKSAVMYVKYNGLKSLIITGLFYLIGNSTGGSGDTLVTVLRWSTGVGRFACSRVSVTISKRLPIVE